MQRPLLLLHQHLQQKLLLLQLHLLNKRNPQPNRPPLLQTQSLLKPASKPNSGMKDRGASRGFFLASRQTGLYHGSRPPTGRRPWRDCVCAPS